MPPARKRPIFTAYNRHDDKDGCPPYFTTADAPKEQRYFGYFESRGGAQLLFAYEYRRDLARFWSGATKWKNEVQVVEVSREQLDPPPDEYSSLGHNWVALGSNRALVVPGWRMQPEELVWLASCWKACHAEQ